MNPQTQPGEQSAAALSVCTGLLGSMHIGRRQMTQRGADEHELCGGRDDPHAMVVRKQGDARADVINDGEMSKPSYATCIKDTAQSLSAPPYYLGSL